VTIGVLAMQGDFAEHMGMLHRMPTHGGERVQPLEVRTLGEMAACDGLILPGGESTTIGKLLRDFHLLEPLRERVREGMPVFGSCAGAIALARTVRGLDQPLIGLMDISVQRNAYGRQQQSFEIDLPVPDLGERPVRAIFIRAPAITSAAPGVSVLARLPDGSIAAARQRTMLAISFHPELAGDDRLHRYFADMVLGVRRAAA